MVIGTVIAATMAFESQFGGDAGMRAADSSMETTATFVVRVSRKPGEPWKGNVAWVTERCQQNFSSMQELLELIDDTLDGADLDFIKGLTEGKP